MTRALPVAALILLGACTTISESRVNPMNWFGASSPEPVAQAQPGTLAPAGGYARARDERAPIAQITEMEVHRVAGGAVVRAAGLPPQQGWWNAALVAENAGNPIDGVLTYRFAASPPPAQTRVGRPVSREITAAVHLSDRELAGVREIAVRGSQNRRVARR